MPLSNILASWGYILELYGENGQVNGNYYYGAIRSNLFTPAITVRKACVDCAGII